MPYQSPAQLRFMHAVHPDIAARWDRENPQNAKAMARGKRKRRRRGRPRSPQLGQKMPPTGGPGEMLTGLVSG